MTTTTASHKLFTRVAANRSLPLVRVIVQDIVELYGDVKDREQRLEALRRAKSRRGRDLPLHQEEVDQVQADLERDVTRLNGFFTELLELGIELRDPARGSVDFPTRRGREPACWSWQLGETQVETWHLEVENFDQRHPVGVDAPTEDDPLAT